MVQERGCRHKGCRNKISTDSPIMYCYVHEHEQLAVTPKGQHGFRKTTGPGSWQHRLQKERSMDFPTDSAEVRGYPFFTNDDLNNHIKYINGDESYKPTAANVLERYPLQSIIMTGRNLTGSEIAVVDESGNIHSLDGKEPEYADEMRGFSVDNGKKTLGVADDETYQVIIIDDAAIMDAAVEKGIKLQVVG